MERLNILIDTNVMITLDPLGTVNPDVAGEAAPLQRLIQEGDHRLFIHPLALADFRRDSRPDRQATRLALFDKYVPLPNPPRVTPDMIARIGGTAPRTGGNNDVDNHHLAAVEKGAVSWLVTEDQGLIRKAQRLGLGAKVGTIADAIAFLEALSPGGSPPPLHLQMVKAHAIDLTDPIFNSLRDDYPLFDQWYDDKCRREHRDVLYISTTSNGYAGICVLKVEEGALKICTLKVADEHSGYRYGELLLRGAFEYCQSRDLGSCYLTVFPEHEILIAMLEDFGFRVDAVLANSELRMVKRFAPEAGDPVLPPLAHHIAYGPNAIRPVAGQIFAIPVQPQWARWLFPDIEAFQYTLFQDKAVANALRKAYLSNGNTRSMEPGATLLFYLSGRDKTVRAVGVLEDILVSRDPGEVASFVGKRTVYSMTDITGLCESRDVLALLFRQDRILNTPITLDELQAVGLGGPPQSISALQGEEAAAWLSQRLAA